jgi:hypothetical protein
MTRVYRPGTSSIWQWIGDAPPGHQDRPSPKALEDLARRRALGERTDVTGRLLGDPPPGRSALDRKREAAERVAAITRQQSEDGEQ